MGSTTAFVVSSFNRGKGGRRTRAQLVKSIRARIKSRETLIDLHSLTRKARVVKLDGKPAVKIEANPAADRQIAKLKEKNRIAENVLLNITASANWRGPKGSARPTTARGLADVALGNLAARITELGNAIGVRGANARKYATLKYATRHKTTLSVSSQHQLRTLQRAGRQGLRQLKRELTQLKNEVAATEAHLAQSTNAVDKKAAEIYRAEADKLIASKQQTINELSSLVSGRLPKAVENFKKRGPTSWKRLGASSVHGGKPLGSLRAIGTTLGK